MIGLVPRPIHALLDYAWSALAIFSPQLFGFAEDKTADAYCKLIGGGTIAASLITRYELGLVKLLPFNLHLKLDLMGALLGMASPWLLGFHKNEKARTAVLGLAIFEVLAVLLSKPDKK